MSDGHEPAGVQLVQERDDGHRTYFVYCSCTPERAVGALDAYPRDIELEKVTDCPKAENHRADQLACWAVRDEADGQVTFKPSLDLSRAPHAHFHTGKPFTSPLVEYKL